MKLNFERERVVRMRASIGKPDDIYHADDRMCFDWITMYDELASRDKAIREAAEEMDELKKGAIPAGDWSEEMKRSYKNGYSASGLRASNILRNHFPELKEDSNE